jgi:GTP cyclohydrolase III
MPELLKIRARANTPIQFHVEIKVGGGETSPPKEATNAFNKALKKVKEDFQLR